MEQEEKVAQEAYQGGITAEQVEDVLHLLLTAIPQGVVCLRAQIRQKRAAIDRAWGAVRARLPADISRHDSRWPSLPPLAHVLVPPGLWRQEDEGIGCITSEQVDGRQLELGTCAIAVHFEERVQVRHCHVIISRIRKRKRTMHAAPASLRVTLSSVAPRPPPAATSRSSLYACL